MKFVGESPESTYRAALKSGRFQIQNCSACTSHIFPPRITCPACGASDLHWQPAKGSGTVYSCTIVNRKAEQGGPYNVVIVDLDEGVRMMSHVTGFGSEEVPLDTRVSAKIEADTCRLVFTAEAQA
ncbi:OB-fold domain-containing protein [Pseudophaeobacter sp.]|jgi:uncharacterized OB-fold protein|uniref:Zn-ribbon domain-containing OB-fold protein n=1 Tax=Pseudophaeobacter sp. TaxID=1971739 RepID=UPI0032D96C8A